MVHKRQIYPNILSDLLTKMVFISGPRQCGKTTLAECVLKEMSGAYFNWDVQSHRNAIRKNQLDEKAQLWVFDELHKYRPWRNWLKGVYDLHHARHHILVTGSARLDIYSRGGDSLQGRYFPYRLHPFTLSEYLGIKPMKTSELIPQLNIPASAGVATAIKDMLELSGFPEPLFSSSKTRAKRWRMGYGQRLIREDIKDLETLLNLDKLELLYERLPDVVGSVLSLNSLREDLEVAYGTIRNWMKIFEKMFSVFRLSPYGAHKIKAVKKEQKLYLWDWSRVESEGGRFENFIASHLLRLIHWCEDIEGEKLELRYFRDTLGREVDFIILRKSKPWIAIEAKLSDQPLDPNLKYFLQRVKVPYAFQVSLHGTKHYRHQDINGCQIMLLPASHLLANLP